MKVHLVQLDSVWENPPANFAAVDRLLAARPPEAGALVVLPEMFATGFSLNKAATGSAQTSEIEEYVRALARRHAVGVLAGVTHPGKEGQVRNEAVVYSPQGEVLARYLKQRPFSGAGEDLAHERGTETVLFSWEGAQIALFVCYDLRFPELFRTATRAGAQVLMVIAAWPVTRIDHWLTLLRARAIENQAWVVGVNRTGNEPKFQYCGRSVIVDPQGLLVADAGEAEGALPFTFDAGAASAWREAFPAVRDFLRWS